jgi:predicted transcriptional regulator
MAATRENVLAAIVKYVEDNKRRAPAKDIAVMVGDKLPVVQGIIKALVSEGAIESSRGRNGGALPEGVTLDKSAKTKKVKVEAVEPASEKSEDSDVAAQFAALVEKLEAESGQFESAAV